ncbi:DUF5106 domain-containing protein [Flammeovirga aprica]|uniref:DUF5106 domain-containing protein n=1 Tax=Flammeovirga aprica JL-4 TaxID=694437 RepID=A0A7X9RTN1_9BACT|nr:DUF5106 domain-containing protein [Flammeovirga aprica]NME67534.1 DUF5106 domain-containing protein [Flammeovirga aprica JL-4]
MKQILLYTLFIYSVTISYAQSIDFGYTDTFWADYDIQNISNQKDSEKVLFKYIYGLSKMNNSSKTQQIHFFTQHPNQTEETLLFYLEIFDKTLFNPNSPFRNEGLYEIILKEFKNNPLINELYKERIKYQLNVIDKNRVGDLANNFNFEVDGKVKNLYSIVSPYTLLVFTNSECPSCIENYKEIDKSSVLREKIDMQKLKVLMIDNSGKPSFYKDDHWLWAKDIDNIVDEDKLYYTPALPSIYLLDKDKRVILKDCPLQSVSNYFNNIGYL